MMGIAMATINQFIKLPSMISSTVVLEHTKETVQVFVVAQDTLTEVTTYNVNQYGKRWDVTQLNFPCVKENANLTYHICHENITHVHAYSITVMFPW